MNAPGRQRVLVFDQLARVGVWIVALAVAVLPVWMAVDLFENGVAALSWSFLTEPVIDSGREGGIVALLASTGLVLLVCLLVVVPIGLACALYINEVVDPASWKSRVIGRTLDVLSSVPSIVFGLFGYLFFAQTLGLGFSILSGGLSLACMVLPLFIRLSEQAFRRLPMAYRQGAEALNISLAGFIWRILLPASASGLAAASIISIGRALAETAVLIFTAGYVTRMPDSVMDSGRVLSVHIYDLAMNVPGGTENAAATAIILMVLLILINAGARWVSRSWSSL